jgi:predicted RNA-binding protein with TRAM domain
MPAGLDVAQPGMVSATAEMSGIVEAAGDAEVDLLTPVEGGESRGVVEHTGDSGGGVAAAGKDVVLLPSVDRGYRGEVKVAGDDSVGV